MEYCAICGGMKPERAVARTTTFNHKPICSKCLKELYGGSKNEFQQVDKEVIKKMREQLG